MGKEFPRCLPCGSAISNLVWLPPGDDHVKINFDVGFVEPESYRVAVVGRNSGGRCLWWRVRKFVGQPPAVVGEARAAMEGALLAQEKGWSKVVLEGDCAQIITAIRDGLTDHHLPFGALVSTIISTSMNFNYFSCSFVPRSGNRLAHALAHFDSSSFTLLEDSTIYAGLATIK